MTIARKLVTYTTRTIGLVLLCGLVFAQSKSKTRVEGTTSVTGQTIHLYNNTTKERMTVYTYLKNINHKTPSGFSIVCMLKDTSYMLYDMNLNGARLVIQPSMADSIFSVSDTIFVAGKMFISYKYYY